MTMTGTQKYPGASTAYWYENKYGGDSMESNVIAWHTTEGTSLPTYDGGSMAPNLTAVPDFAAKRLKWYQHFNFDTSSRALVNLAGGVQTNTLNVCQVEIVGTCDPSSHKKWASTPHLYTPELPDWAIRDLAAFAKWAHDQHGVPLTSGVTFKAYPGSYGTSNGVRMSASKWTAFSGHCGHQHVPENLHGDPGLFPMAAILAAAAGGATPPKENTVTVTDDYVKALRDNLLIITSLTEKDSKGAAVKHGAGYFLAHIQAQLVAVQATEAAQTAALTALATAIGKVDAAVDVPALVAEVKAAIEAAVSQVVIHLDVPDAS
jgi:hypothetical protein